MGEGLCRRALWYFSAIPADSITRALVVIPTNSPLNHSKSNSPLIGKRGLVWGTRGRRFESCLPDIRRSG